MTANQAAAEIRHKIIRKMDSLERNKKISSYTECWIKLRKFINGMAKRASAKRGGLGALVIVALMLSSCGDPDSSNADNVIWGGIALGFNALHPKPEPTATEQQRRDYSIKQDRKYWSKVRDSEHPHGYAVDENGWPIGYYKDP